MTLLLFDLEDGHGRSSPLRNRKICLFPNLSFDQSAETYRQARLHKPRTDLQAASQPLAANHVVSLLLPLRCSPAVVPQAAQRPKVLDFYVLPALCSLAVSENVLDKERGGTALSVLERHADRSVDLFRSTTR